MIYELTLIAVRRKLYDFDHVPRFINACEITCALGMGCRQAGLPLPTLEPGMDVMSALEQFAPPVLSDSHVENNIKEALRKYFKLGETITEDALATLKIGYENAK